MRSSYFLAMFAVGALAACEAQADPINVPCAAPGAPANTVCPPSGQTVITETAVNEQNVVTTTNAQTVNSYQTELIGQLQGGPALFDQIFGVAFGDPSLASVDAQIRSILLAAASGPLSFTGPALVSSSQSTTTASKTVVNSDLTYIYTGQADRFGPITLTDVGSLPLLYSNDVTCAGLDITVPATLSAIGTALPTGCTSTGPYFQVLSGLLDINLYTTTLDDITQTTTNTSNVLITQVYDIVGIPRASTPVPEPETLALFAAGLGGLLLRRRRGPKVHGEFA